MTQMKLGDRVAKIGETTVWIVKEERARGSVYVELAERVGGAGEIYGRKLTVTGQRDWTVL